MPIGRANGRRVFTLQITSLGALKRQPSNPQAPEASGRKSQASSPFCSDRAQGMPRATRMRDGVSLGELGGQASETQQSTRQLELRGPI